MSKTMRKKVCRWDLIVVVGVWAREVARERRRARREWERWMREGRRWEAGMVVMVRAKGYLGGLALVRVVFVTQELLDC